MTEGIIYTPSIVDVRVYVHDDVGVDTNKVDVVISVDADGAVDVLSDVETCKVIPMLSLIQILRSTFLTFLQNFFLGAIETFPLEEPEL